MSCPHCLSTPTSKRKHRTSPGFRTFFCPGCRKRFNERTGSPFNDLQFPTDVVLLTVLWRLRYKLSFRDVAELLLQRGFVISHETIRVWEFLFAPMVNENLRSKRRGKAGVSWYLDETYIKVGGRWRYLYHAIDRAGNHLDSMLNEKRDSAGEKPLRITTDKYPAYTKAIRWIVGRGVLHRQNQYLNNRMDRSHRSIQQRYYPMLGFQNFESASRFCSAFDELHNYLRVRSADDEPIPASHRREFSPENGRL